MVRKILSAGLIGFVFVCKIDVLEAIILAANDESRTVVDKRQKMRTGMK